MLNTENPLIESSKQYLLFDFIFAPITKLFIACHFIIGFNYQINTAVNSKNAAVEADVIVSGITPHFSGVMVVMLRSLPVAAHHFTRSSGRSKTVLLYAAVKFIFFITADKALIKAKADGKNRMYVEKIIY